MEQIKINRVGKHCYWKKNIFNQLFTVELWLYCIVLQYFNIFQWNGFIFVWKFNWNLVSYATIIIIRFIGLKFLIKKLIPTFLCPRNGNFLRNPEVKKNSCPIPIVWQAIQHNLWFILCSDQFFCQDFLPTDQAWPEVLVSTAVLWSSEARKTPAKILIT